MASATRLPHVSDELIANEYEPSAPEFVQEGPGLFDSVSDQAEAPAVAEKTSDGTPEAPAALLQGKGAQAVSESAGQPPLALYRRYRPDTFDEVIGQEHVTEPLKRALVNNRVNHAYLFSGPRGCGKTTSARILARCLNCEQGPTPIPCGQCQSCRDLARGGGGSIDVIEIDAASHGGVEDARDLRERAYFAPVNSRYKIYIVDEAHMVTSAGFNAMLKLVEEPPEHVKFIFATTEPDKVIGTIRSRTHHYPFRLVPPKTMANYLAQLCEQEKVNVDPEVLPLVVRAGAGSVRDSLSVLDQLLGGAADSGVSYHQAVGLLGYTPDALLDEMVDALAECSGEKVFASIDHVMENGQEPRRFAEDLLLRLRDLVVISAVPEAISSGLVDVAPDQTERLQKQAQQMGLNALTRAAEIISEGLTQMRGTTTPRLQLELMCAKVLVPDSRAVPVSDSAPAVHDNIPTSARIGMPSVGQPAPKPIPADYAQNPAQQSQPYPQKPVPTVGALSQNTAGPAGVTLAQVRQAWDGIMQSVQNKRRFTWILLSQNAQVVDVNGDSLLLAFASEGARNSWARGGNEAVLQAALQEQLRVNLQIEPILDAAAMVPQQRGRGQNRRPASAPPPTPVPETTPESQIEQTQSVMRQPISHSASNLSEVSAPPAVVIETSATVGSNFTQNDLEPDEEGSLDDPNVDLGPDSGAELLAAELGAKIIEED